MTEKDTEAYSVTNSVMNSDPRCVNAKVDLTAPPLLLLSLQQVQFSKILTFKDPEGELLTLLSDSFFFSPWFPKLNGFPPVLLALLHVLLVPFKRNACVSHSSSLWAL